eukprot:s90_g20.t1
MSATLLTNRTHNEYQDLNNPDEYVQATRLADKQVMWLVLTKVEVNKLKEAETTPFYFQSLHGSIRLARWDKLVLSTDEALTLQLWQVTTINVDGNILGTVTNNLSWDNGFLWHYNMPIPVMQVTETKHPWFRALVNSLEYTGTSVLSTMPTEVQQRVEQLLMHQHPLLEHGFQLPYHGSKTKERLRGNKSIFWSGPAPSTPAAPQKESRRKRRVAQEAAEETASSSLAASMSQLHIREEPPAKRACRIPEA